MSIFHDIFGIETKEEKEVRKAEDAKYPDLKTSEKPTSKEEKTQKEEREWQDIIEQKKFVCQGGKAKCKYHSGEVEIAPTSTEVMLQDKPYVTTGDKDGKVNFKFSDKCTHPKWGKDKPPCKSVISLGAWKNFSNTYIDNYNAILVESTIPCMISGEDLKVTDSGQKAELTELEPEKKKEPRVIEAYWRNKYGEKISKTTSEKPAELYVRTEGYEDSENKTVTIVLKKKNQETFANGETELELKVSVNGKGIGIIKDFQKWM